MGNTGNGSRSFGTGILVLDAKGGVCGPNDVLLGQLDKGLEQVKGLPLMDVLDHLPMSSGSRAECARLMADTGPFTIRSRDFAPNGEDTCFDVVFTPLAGPGGLGEELLVLFMPCVETVYRDVDLYRMAMEGTSDAVWELDLVSFSSVWGAGMRELLRVPAAEQEVGVDVWLSRVPKQAADRLMDLGREYREGLIDHHMEEYPIRCFDGTVRWMLDRGCVLERDEKGKPCKVVGVVTDIDRVKRAEEGLARTEHRLAEVFKAFGAAVMLEDEQHRILLVNDAFCAFTGFARHELEGAFAYDILADPRAIGQFNAPELFVEQVGALVMNRVPVQGQRLDMKNGRVFEFDYTPIVSEMDGSGHLWVCRDVSERNRLQAALGSSQRLLSAVVDRIGVGVVMDEENRIRLANDTLYRIFGAELEASALVGQDMDEAILGNAHLFRDPQAFVESSMRCKEGMRAVDGELMTLADGRIVERDFMPLELPGGRRGNLFTYRDVTERQRMVEELSISGELLSTVIGSLDSGLLLEDGERRIRLANQAFCNLFGVPVPPEQLRGMECATAAEEAAKLMVDPGAFLRGIQAALDGRTPSPVEELHLLDGRILERSYEPLRLSASELGHLWVYRDVTERHRLEQEKREAHHRNEQLLAAVAQATAALVRGGAVLDAVNEGISAVGRATKVDRVYLFQNKLDAMGRIRTTSQRIEWNSGDAEPQIDNPDLQDTPADLFGEFVDDMEAGRTWMARVADLDPAGLRSVLEPQGILSILILPITVRGLFWGFMGFDQCTYEREWTSNERSILLSLCASVASALERELLIEERSQVLAAHRSAIRFTERIMGLTEERAVYEALVQELSASAGLKKVSVHTVDVAAGTLTCVASNAADPALFTVQPLGDGMAADVVRERMPQCTHEMQVQEVGGPDAQRLLFMVPVVSEDDTAALIQCEAMGAPANAEFLQRLPLKLASLAGLKVMQVRSFLAARLQELRYRRILANMDLGLIELDPAQRITMVNDKLCTMAGWPREELLGRQLSELDGLHGSLGLLAEKGELRSKGLSDAFEMTMNTRSGEERHWFVSGAAQLDAEGRFTGSVSVILDITDRRRMERELIDANTKAGEALQAKELFLANMSHEMRTPMNAIVGLCSEMLREATDALVQARLGAVITAGNNLMKLMNDLLDASRAAMGMIQLEQVPMDAAACMRQVEMVMRPMALQKGIAMHCHIDEEARHRLLGDERRLDQLLLNLLGNALKFTVQGRVDLMLTVLGSTSTHQSLRFTVRDTGVGIDPVFMPHLFQPFSRDPALAGKAMEGTGLGLSICKHLVDLMHGEIRVDSHPGEGTEVTVDVVFPIAGEAHRPAVDTPNEILQQPPKGMRILLVEDSAFNRMVVKSMLTGLGIVMDEAEQGAEALAMMCNNAYDLVLLDLRMPVMDGHEFTRALRKELRSNVPVVALTAGDDPEQELLAQGMNAVLRKPLDRARLMNTLAACVKEAGAPGGWTPDRSTDELRLDTSMVHDLVGGDEALFREVIEAFLKDTPQNMASLCKALAEGDMSRIAEVAHRLRPSICMLNLVDVLDKVDALVALGRHPRSAAYVATAVVSLISRLQLVSSELRRMLGEQ